MTNYIQSPLPHSSRVQKELDYTKLLSKALFSLDHASQNTGCEKQLSSTYATINHSSQWTNNFWTIFHKTNHVLIYTGDYEGENTDKATSNCN